VRTRVPGSIAHVRNGTWHQANVHQTPLANMLKCEGQHSSDQRGSSVGNRPSRRPRRQAFGNVLKHRVRVTLALTHFKTRRRFG
jgi:hypothetical protein